MIVSRRLEAALAKLYEAYNSHELHPEDACRCAVGNIMDRTDTWKHFSDEHGAEKLNYVGKVHEALGRKFNGYSPFELLKIEAAFLKGCGYSLPLNYNGIKPKDPKNSDLLFNGLQKTIKVLCKLDHIPNVMDEITKVFEKVNLRNKKQILSEV